MRGERERERGSERAISRYSQLAASLSTSFALFFRRSPFPHLLHSIFPIYLEEGWGWRQEANIPIRQYDFPPADPCAYLDSVTCAIYSHCLGALMWLILLDSC